MRRGIPGESRWRVLRRRFAEWWYRSSVRRRLGGLRGGGLQTRLPDFRRRRRRRAHADGGTTDAVGESLADAYDTDDRPPTSPHTMDRDTLTRRLAGTFDTDEARQRVADAADRTRRWCARASHRAGRWLAAAGDSTGRWLDDAADRARRVLASASDRAGATLRALSVWTGRQLSRGAKTASRLLADAWVALGVERRYRELVHFAFGSPETPTGRRFFRFGVLLGLVSAAYLTSGVLLLQSVPPVLGSTVGAVAVGGAAVASMGIGLILIGLTLTQTSPQDS